MASSSSPSQILCASFNQDNSMFSVGTKDGFKIFDARTGKLCYENSTHHENHAELWQVGEQIGGAIVDNDVSLYRLRFLETLHE